MSKLTLPFERKIVKIISSQKCYEIVETDAPIELINSILAFNQTNAKVQVCRDKSLPKSVKNAGYHYKILDNSKKIFHKPMRVDFVFNIC